MPTKLLNLSILSHPLPRKQVNLLHLTPSSMMTLSTSLLEL
jgi:hypothetical protein